MHSLIFIPLTEFTHKLNDILFTSVGKFLQLVIELYYLNFINEMVSHVSFEPFNFTAGGYTHDHNLDAHELLHFIYPDDLSFQRHYVFNKVSTELGFRI